MNVADIMTTRVITVPPQASIADAVRLMLSQRISGLPVVDPAGALVGILTEGDLLRRAEIDTEKQEPAWLGFLRGPANQAKDYVRSHARRVDDLMTTKVVTVPATASLEEIVRVMEQRRVKRVPVTADGKLVGVVSRADLLRLLAQELDKTPPSAPDSVIRKHLAETFASQPWCRGNRVDAVVVDGTVFLEGLIFDERDRTAIRVTAESAAGVTAVEDHLEYADPNAMYAFGR